MLFLSTEEVKVMRKICCLNIYYYDYWIQCIRWNGIDITFIFYLEHPHILTCLFLHNPLRFRHGKEFDKEDHGD